MHKEKGLSVFSLTMMALGTVIGGSFFLGSAIPIKNLGPNVILAYILGGILIYFILFALSEMTVADPSVGSFRTYAQRAYGNGLGFIVGWVYYTGLVLAMSSEAVAISTFIRFWFPNLATPIIGTLIIILIILINLLGTDKLSQLESGLAIIKILTIIGFIAIALILIFGFIPNTPKVDFNHLTEGYSFNKLSKLPGSMLLIIFSYAGFEIIGLAASETPNPHETIPKAIKYTVFLLVSLYTLSAITLLPLIPVNELTTEVSPMVIALTYNKIYFAGKIINFILITAILSTMLAATYGLARMLRSLSNEGYAPKFLKEEGDIPRKCIIFSGFAMLLAFSLSFILPEHVYIFLVSSSGFALLFTYLVIVLSHLKFRKKQGCPPKGKCQLPLYPLSSYISIIGLIIIIISMPFIKGQGLGLIAGISLLIFFFIAYLFVKNKPKVKT